MEPEDPFDWIVDICQVSSSEESRLRRCSYFGMSDSDNSDSRIPRDIPVATTGITMVSPPESPLVELPDDQYTLPEDPEIFHAPVESRSTSTFSDNCYNDRMIGNGHDLDGETVAVGADSADRSRGVDLGRDTDLGFSEVEVDPTQRIEANSNLDGTFQRESEEIRVSESGFSRKGQLSAESPSKRLKSLDFESSSELLGTPKESNKKWNFKDVSLSPGASSELCVNGRVGNNERADEELDVNARETVHLVTNSDSLSEDFEEITLLDVLVELKKDCEEDRSLECLSLLEVAERKWGKFSNDE